MLKYEGKIICFGAIAMAESNNKRYPAVPNRAWFAVRKRFVASPPRGEVTPELVASITGTNEESARKTVISQLKIVGILGEDNKLTERGVKWRDDDQYAAVCNEILEEIYPQPLKDIAPNITSDRSAVVKWFKNNLVIGDTRAEALATFYWLLLEADLSKADDASLKQSASAKPSTARKQNKPTSSPVTAIQDNDQSKNAAPASDLNVETSTPLAQPVPQRKNPSLHIDIQIHISPEATPEQIDQIFASMGKHLREL